MLNIGKSVLSDASFRYTLTNPITALKLLEKICQFYIHQCVNFMCIDLSILIKHVFIFFFNVLGLPRIKHLRKKDLIPTKKLNFLKSKLLNISKATYLYTKSHFFRTRGR